MEEVVGGAADRELVTDDDDETTGGAGALSANCLRLDIILFVMSSGFIEACGDACGAGVDFAAGDDADLDCVDTGDEVTHPPITTAVVALGCAAAAEEAAESGEGRGAAGRGGAGELGAEDDDGVGKVGLLVVEAGGGGGATTGTFV